MAPQPDSLDAILLAANLDASPENADRLVALGAGFFMLPISNRPDPYDFNAASFQTLEWTIGSIYPRMEQEFERSTLEQSKGVIVALYARFSLDSVLLKKLLEFGFLDQLLTILALPATRTVALDALCTISQNADTDALLQIAEQTSQPLLRVLKDVSDAADVEIALKALAQTVVPAISLKQALLFMDIAQAFIDTLRSHPSPPILALVLGFIVEMPAEIKLTPSMVGLLVAGLRSRDWVLRSRCLAGLRNFVAPHVQTEPRVVLQPLNQRMDGPPQLMAAMHAYGYERCASIERQNAEREQVRLAGVRQETDPYKLGKAMAALALKFRTKLFELVCIGDTFSNHLPCYIHAIRAKGIPGEANIEHILYFEYLRLQDRETMAPLYARDTLKQDPDFAYAYYVLAPALPDRADGLRCVKRGSKCTPGPFNLTEFLRVQFLQRGTEWAGELAVQALTNAETGSDDWKVGIAIVQSALEDGEAFLALAPPDHRDMRAVVSWLIVLHAMTDDKLSDDLRELKRYVARLSLADDFTRWLKPFGNVPVLVPKTEIRLIADTIVDNFAGAQKEWGMVFGEYDLALESGPEKEAVPYGHAPGLALVESYRCSWCHNPSALLRGCSGCLGARYCDEDARSAIGRRINTVVWRRRRKVMSSLYARYLVVYILV